MTCLNVSVYKKDQKNAKISYFFCKVLLRTYKISWWFFKDQKHVNRKMDNLKWFKPLLSKKKIWKTTVFKVSTNQALQKPSTWRKSSKFKSESFYMVAARTEWAPPSEGVMARSPSIFTSIFTCGTCGLKSMRKNSKPWLIRNDEIICRECSKQ